MTAPSIVNVTYSATQAKYPQRIEILVEWDQPLFNVRVENLIFETEQEPGITITGYTPAEFEPAPIAVYLGQTLIREDNIRLPSPSSVLFSFEVSPFMQGTLRVSNQSWNKPLFLNAENVDGVKGDWSPLLAPGLFSNVVCSPYYDVIDPTPTTSINWEQPLRGTPKLRFDWACNGGVSQFNDGTDIRIGTDPADMSSKPIVEWDGGNFWWWGACGLKGSKNPLPPYPWENYYSTSDTRTCRGPDYYLWGGAGGQVLDSTQLPTYTNFIPWESETNIFGSKLASNYVFNSPSVGLYKGQQACYIFGNSPDNKLTRSNSSVGRLERWILANPEKGDPLRDMPSSWTDRISASGNNFCLAPWRLAKDTDPVPMLIQVYFQLNWIYTTNAPG